MPNAEQIRTTEVAKQFVELVLKYDKKEWQTTFALPTQEMTILFSVVLAAGFEANEVIVGKLVGHYHEQDGGPTGETYPINSVCPFKVMSEGGENHYKATGWLDRALQRVLKADSRENREQLIEEIASRIEQSIPLTPIPLTFEGDLLHEYPSDGDGHTRDGNNLGSCAGIHKYCDGWVDRRKTTKNFDCLVCRSCHLRVLFPKEVKTYGELREALAISLLSQKNQRFPGRGEPRYK